MNKTKMKPEDYVKNYTYYVTWSEEDQVYIARIIEYESLAAHGDTPEEALRQIIFVTDDCVRSVIDDGNEVIWPRKLFK